MKNKFTNSKGFTLIEIMATVAILSIVIIGLVTFFSGGIRSWVTGQSQLKAQREARQAMDQMVREIRHGESIGAVENNKSLTVNIPELGEKSAYTVTYSWSGNPGESLKRDTNIFIEYVKNFYISELDDSKVNIVLEIDVDNDGNADIKLNSEVNLRNYGL